MAYPIFSNSAIGHFLAKIFFGGHFLGRIGHNNTDLKFVLFLGAEKMGGHTDRFWVLYKSVVRKLLEVKSQILEYEFVASHNKISWKGFKIITL